MKAKRIYQQSRQVKNREEKKSKSMRVESDLSLEGM